jgi:hypothetical protein
LIVFTCGQRAQQSAHMSAAAAAGGARVAAAAAAAIAEEPVRPKVEFVSLVSGEGHEFRVLKEAAVLSGAVRAMLASDFVESHGVIEFKEISTAVLEKIVQ